MGDAAGHYFDAEPGAPPRGPATVRLDLPDLSLRRCATDRGVFAADRRRRRHQVPAPRGARAARRRAPSSTSAAATGRSPARSPAGRPAPRCGRSTSTAGPSTCAGQRRRARPRRTSRVADARRRARRPRRRPHLVEPADPHRQGRAARAARRPGSAGSPRRARPCSSCRSTSAPTRSSAGSTAQGWAVDAARAREPGYRLLEVRPRVKQLDGTGLKRLHREWRRRTEGRLAPRARRRAGPVQRRRDHPHRRRPAGRATCGWPAARPDPTTPRSARPRSAPTATSTCHRVDDRRSRPSTRPGPPGTGWSASSWPTAPCPSTSSTSATATCLVVGHEDRGLPPPRSPRATPSPTSRSSAGSARSTWPRRPSIACYEVRRQAWTRRPRQLTTARRATSRRSVCRPWPSPASASSPPTSSPRRPSSSAARCSDPSPTRSAAAWAERLATATRRTARSPARSWSACAQWFPARGSPCPGRPSRRGRGHGGRRAPEPPAPGPPQPADAGRSCATPSTPATRRSPSSSRPSARSTDASATAPATERARIAARHGRGPLPRRARRGSIKLVDPAELRPPLEAVARGRGGPAPPARCSATDGCVGPRWPA